MTISGHIPDNSLFWALRGGGGGTWGAITAMTVKLHLPRNDCTVNCYHVNTRVYYGSFEEDDGKMAADLTNQFLIWMQDVSDYWSGFFFLEGLENMEYRIVLSEFMYTGNVQDEDAMSLENHFA